jgi:MFS family permease
MTGSQITQFFIATTGLFIAKELDISSQYSWLGVAINLGYVSTAPSAGYLQDMFGRRNALIIGSLFDILGNIIIATSHSFPQIVAGSIIAGIGSAITELTTTAA